MGHPQDNDNRQSANSSGRHGQEDEQEPELGTFCILLRGS